MITDYSAMNEITDSALLASVLGVRETGLEVRDLSEVMTAPTAIAGVGEKRAAKLYAVQELARRLMVREARKVDIIHGPEDAAHLLMPMVRYENREHFMLLLLDTKNHVLAVPTVSVGGLSSAIVHPREVFQAALRYPTAAMILAHNHPSGDPSPSREDIAVTNRLVKAGKVMDIPVLDHVVLGDKRFVSFKEKGLL